MRQVVAFFLALLLAGAFAGCGGGSKPGTTGTTTNPPTSSPTPTPPTMPSPAPTPPTTPSPTPPPTAGSTQWSSNVNGATGTVTVSTTGNVSVQVTKALPSTTYVGNFCQYPSSDWSNMGLNPCFGLPSLTTDASGNGQLAFHFPQSGIWAGAFIFAVGGDTNSPSRIDTDNIGTAVTLTAPLVPLGKANGGGAPNDPISRQDQDPGSGSVSLSGGNVTIKVTGEVPNASFRVIQAFSDGGSATQQIGTLTTDGSGNAMVTMPVLSSSGSLIDVERIIPIATNGLVTGFTVP